VQGTDGALVREHKDIPVEGIEVSVERDASQERAGIYRLSAALSLTGDLSAAQREELLRVAQKCPIHKLMTEVTTEISTRYPLMVRSFYSNLIASCAQPDTGFPPKVVAGR